MDAAHIHLMLNHVPVLGAFATLGLIILADFKDDAAFTRLALQFMVLMGILTLPVYFSGEPAEELIEHLPGVAESFIEEHERFAKFGLALTELVAVIGAVGLYTIRKKPDSIKSYWRSIEVVAFANVLLMIATANLGGKIRHTEIRKAGVSSQQPNETQPSGSDSDD